MFGQLTGEEKNALFDIKAQVKEMTIRTFLLQWYKHLGMNRANPERKGLAEFDIPDSRNKDTLVIVAPGASLELYEQKLDKLADSATICVMPTALDYALKHRLHVDFVVVVDSQEHAYGFLEGYEGKVLATTYCDPRIAEEWDTYLFSVLQDNGDISPKLDENGEVVGNELWWINATTRMVDDDIHYGFPSLGCVTNMAVNLVQDLRMRGVLAARRIVLLGADHSYYQGKGRVPRSEKFDDEIPWATEDVFYWDDHLTNFKMVYYTHALYALWSSQTAPIYNVCHGLMEELPKVTFDQVMSGEFPKYPKREWVDNQVDGFFKKIATRLDANNEASVQLVTKEEYESK